MIPTSDLLSTPVSDLADLIASREISARELVELSLRQVEMLDVDINAFTWVDHGRSMVEAESIKPGDPRPFAGIPIAIKDLTALASAPWTHGSALAGNNKAPCDAYVVRRLKRAGFIIIGKTNSSEFGVLPVTEPARFGPSHNPWDLSRTPGGSSGGAAAAVAAGMLPLAQGSDGAGSIRVPAACCGLVGLKPSRGRISRGPLQGDSFLVTDGILTRTVADTAAVLDAVSGYERGDATWAPPFARPLMESTLHQPVPLRIALFSRSPLDGSDAHPDCRDAVHHTAHVLESLGHVVEEVPSDVGLQDIIDAFGDYRAAELAANVEAVVDDTGRKLDPNSLEPVTWHLVQRGRAFTASRYIALLRKLQNYARSTVERWAPYDAVLTPVLAEPPIQIGALSDAADGPLAVLRKAREFAPFGALWNVTGQPAISLPVARTGLPIGVQLIAQPGRDDLLLSLARQLEDANHLSNRHPSTSAVHRKQAARAHQTGLDMTECHTD